MKAIIVAAGPGSRLRPFTEEKPKCLLEVGGKTILQPALDTLRKNDINDIVIVRGYMKDAINYPDIQYYYNPNYLENLHRYFKKLNVDVPSIEEMFRRVTGGKK